MLQRKERYRSLHFRVFMLVACVFAGILMLMAVQSIYNRTTQQEKEELLSLSVLFNEITIEAEACRNLMEELIENDVLKGGSSFRYEEYQSIRERMQNSAGRLADVMNAKVYSRSTIDLKYMIDTYLQDTAVTINAAKSDDYLELNKNYQKCVQTYEFVQKQMNKVYREIQNNMAISTEQLERYNLYVRGLTWLTLAVILGFGLLLIYLLNRVVIRPINKLTGQANLFSLQTDNPQPTVEEITARSEIGTLHNTLYRMQKRICEQFHWTLEKIELEQQLEAQKVRAVENEKLVKEAELKNLQARINPHFLFNSINLIAKMAYMEQAEQTSEMMESLGEFLRYNLDNFNKIVTLEKEIENIRDYTVIQKIRFGERIHFIIQTEERIGRGQIPCLILQPLVENAIIHGVGMYTHGAVVKVVTRLTQQNRAELIVYDNGVGMNAQVLGKICESIDCSRERIEDGSIGLSNVFQRLQLFFNGDVQIQVESTEQAYTKIRMEIPLWYGET